LAALRLHENNEKVFLAFLFFMFFGFSFQALALELGSYPTSYFSRENFSLSFFREERPSFYWVNIGVPDFFFNGVSQLSGVNGGTVSYSVRSIEYGFRLGGWLDSHARLALTLPFEANAFEDVNGTTHNLPQFGDLEIALTYLFKGNKEKGNFMGVDGKLRLATGTNPFYQVYPLLASGKGASSVELGLEMRQEADGFSFFESIDYEKVERISLNASSVTGPGTFQWPDVVHALGRIEWQVFQRAQREITLFYEFRTRMTGLMRLNGQAISYGDGQYTDQLFFSTGGMLVRVDQELSVEGHGTWFPFELTRPRPDFGLLFSLSVIYRIL